MQTFLPWPDPQASARSLDDARLRKQGIECIQIVRTIMDPTRGYQHHPAVSMWRGHLGALGFYTTEIGKECRRRGFASGWDVATWLLLYRAGEMVARTPWWWGNEAFHLSHQSNLVRKVPSYYGHQFVRAPLLMPYLWPTEDHDLRISKPDLKRIESGERTWKI